MTWIYGRSVPAPQHSRGWLGLHEAIVAPIGLLESNLVSQLITVGVELAYLAFGLQWVPRGSIDAAGDKWGTQGELGVSMGAGGSWRGAEPASLPLPGGPDPSPSTMKHYLS